MIQGFKILDPKRIPVTWWASSETLSAITSMEFAPGLNVLWGRNGSGKSSVLTLLARWFHAEKGGRSMINRESCRVLEPSCPKGPTTLLFDEPERSMDMDKQADMWRLLQQLAKRAQVIVATHSVFALDLPEAKYHELTPGYLGECRKTIEVMGWKRG